MQSYFAHPTPPHPPQPPHQLDFCSVQLFSEAGRLFLSGANEALQAFLVEQCYSHVLCRVQLFAVISLA